MDDLETDKTEMFSALFASVFTKSSQGSVFSERVQGGQLPAVDEDWAKDSLRHLDPYKSIISYVVDLMAIDVLARLITIISE